jgi:hypothetical protein
MTEMHANKLSGAAPRVHRKNSPFSAGTSPISRWELCCGARKNPGAEASMNMAKDSERFDKTCTCGTSCSRSMVTESKATFSYLYGAVCPFPYPKGFPQPKASG